MFSPHISNQYQQISRDIRRVLEHGYTETQHLIETRQERVLELRGVQQSARQAQKAFRAATSPCFFCWSQRDYEYAYSSRSDASGPPVSGWSRYSGANVTIPVGVAAEAIRVLTLKRKLYEIALRLELFVTELESIAAAIRTFARISPALVSTDIIRRTGEAVFRTIPWSGFVFRYMAPSVWSRIGAGDHVAAAFVASAIEGHTLAAVRNVRAAQRQHSAWALRPRKSEAVIYDTEDSL
ncbi:hypothetical protein F5Y19DRAFT_480783 [Xylariaceae sp. FL1651]|nr:hypothetical protein F5Y19DRAFT_480783 [Xylariaceae sp. FL1651]